MMIFRKWLARAVVTMAVAVGFFSAALPARAQLHTAGTLLVNLDADSLTTGASVTSWNNTGTIGNGFSVISSTANNPTVVKRDFARGVDFAGANSAQVLWYGSATGAANQLALPAQLQGTNAWSVELWAWNPSRGTGDQPAVVFGDVPIDAVELGLGTSAAGGNIVEYTSTANAGGWPVSAGHTTQATVTIPTTFTLTTGQWHHFVYTYTGGSTTSTLVRQKVYVDGLLIRDVNTAPVLNTANPSHPGDNETTSVAFSLGGRRVWNTNPGGTGQTISGTILSASLGKVRVHTGVLTPADILNNYNFEKAEYAPSPSLTFLYPSSGKVIECGDAVSPNTTTNPVTFLNSSFANLTVTTYTLTGPDAGAYALSPTSPTTGTLTPGKTISLSVVFKPTTASETSATLTVGTSAGPRQIWLRGNVGRIYVNGTTGNDTTGLGTLGSPYATILKAVNSVSHGGVIQVAGGSYTGFFPATGDYQYRITAPNADVSITSEFGTNSASPNNSTIILEGITADLKSLAVFGASAPSSSGVYSMTGNGTFDLTLRNCKFYNYADAAAVNFVTTTNQIVHFHAFNSIINGHNIPGMSPSQRRPGFICRGTYDDVGLSNCDLRGSASNTYQSLALPSSIVMTNCLLGGDPSSGIVGDDGVRFTSGGASGTIATFTNCTFSNFGVGTGSFRANGPIYVDYGSFPAGGTALNLSLIGCVFSHTAFGHIFSDIPSGNTVPITLTISNCTMDGGDMGGLYLYDGQTINITNSSIINNGGAGVIFASAVSNRLTTATIIGCTIEGGTNPVYDGNQNWFVGGDAPAVEVDHNGLKLTIDRSTFRAGLTQPSLSPGPRSRGILTTDAPLSLHIYNSVIEGALSAVEIRGDALSHASPPDNQVYNDTIVATADANPTQAGIHVTAGSNSTVDVQNTVILGYNTVTSGTVTTSHNFTSGDPKFKTPNPFAVPTSPTLGDYHLVAGSPLIGAGATLAAITKDHDNVDRTTDPIDIGAFKFIPKVNAAKGWWTMY